MHQIELMLNKLKTVILRKLNLNLDSFYTDMTVGPVPQQKMQMQINIFNREENILNKGMFMKNI